MTATIAKSLGILISCGIIMSGVVFYMAYPKDKGIELASDVRRNTQIQRESTKAIKEINRQLQNDRLQKEREENKRLRKQIEEQNQRERGRR